LFSTLSDGSEACLRKPAGPKSGRSDVDVSLKKRTSIDALYRCVALTQFLK